MSELSVLFTTDKAIAAWNEGYRGKLGPTDVLSFSQQEGSLSCLPSPSLGDLVISIDTAKRQAKEYRVSFEKEILRLIIHGTLHLLGFDHEKVKPSVAAKMRRREERLMKVLRRNARALLR